MQHICRFSWALLLERLGQEKSSIMQISEVPGEMHARLFPRKPDAEPGVGKRLVNCEAEKALATVQLKYYN